MILSEKPYSSAIPRYGLIRCNVEEHFPYNELARLSSQVETSKMQTTFRVDAGPSLDLGAPL